MMKRLVTLCLMAIFIVGVSSRPVRAQTNLEAPSQTFDSVLITKKVSQAVVLIKGTTTNADIILGSGFIISSDGKIATNLHVIQNLQNGGVQLASGDKFDSFSILAFDDRKDIAIIKIAGFDLPTLDSGKLK